MKTLTLDLIFVGDWADGCKTGLFIWIGLLYTRPKRVWASFYSFVYWPKGLIVYLCWVYMQSYWIITKVWSWLHEIILIIFLKLKCGGKIIYVWLIGRAELEGGTGIYKLFFSVYTEISREHKTRSWLGDLRGSMFV